MNVHGLTKRYGQFTALEEVSFSLERGDVFGYIGPNGAGKTTTIKIMVGLMQSFEGDVSIDGRSIAKDKRAIHNMLGYLPQQAGFQDWRTVDHALRTFGKLSGVKEGDLERRIEEVLETLGITKFRHRKIIHLSGGTVQKVGMAQAILHEPKLLVLDEPMAGLDPASRYEFKQIFRELSRKGTTIFFSSHILSDVQDIADRIGILNGGRLMHLGSMDDLKRRMRIATEVDIVLSKDAGGWRGIESTPGVKSVRQTEPGRLAVELEDGSDVDAAIDAMIRELMSSGSRIRSVNPVSPTLEELYIRYLGGAEDP
jgi:ABC-type multidrug transport system ATPase subunit